MGTRGEKKEGKTKRKMDVIRRSMTNHGLTEEDNRKRDTWKKLVLDLGKPLYSGQSLDE